ncbi:MAG TPA: hypothetical protein VGN81_18290 [Pseudonocardiaceae bacterium]
MIDHIDLPPERELPEQVKAVARDRLVTGMRDNPGRTNRALVPLAIAAAVILLAGFAVGAAVLGGSGPRTSAGGQTLDTDPYRQLPPEDAYAAYSTTMGAPMPDLGNRCMEQANLEPGGRPAPAQWQPLLTARAHGVAIVVYTTSEGPVFCEVTPTTVALSQPGGPATATARPTFITTSGTVAGTIDPEYQAAWVAQSFTGEQLTVQTPALVRDGIFLVPDAIPVPTNGLHLGVAPTQSAADMRSFTVPQTELPSVVHPTTDVPGAQPVDQSGPAGDRVKACFRGPNSIPVILPKSWLPGAYQRLDGSDSVQVAGLGLHGNMIAICTQRASAPIDLQLVDINGYFDTTTIEDNQLITANSVFYDFQPDQGGQSSDHVSIVGLVLSQAVASVRMSWPGGPNLVASVVNGTYALPGYDLNDPSLHGGTPTISVYSVHGLLLGSYQVKR